MKAATIRPMTAADRQALVDILKMTPEFTAAEVEVALEVIDDHLKSADKSGYLVLVAVIDSVVVGYICYGPRPMTDGTWDMYWAAVRPGYQGRGIGRSLFTAAEENIKHAGGRIIIIETSSKPGYEKTIQFHHAIGYSDVCLIPDFYAIGDDLLILQKRFS
jgi:ribosomal protein S18 acetylase RimI-like enzyme